jgi:hypothetical protein
VCCLTDHVCLQLLLPSDQAFLNFSKSGHTFATSYRVAVRRDINKDTTECPKNVYTIYLLISLKVKLADANPVFHWLPYTTNVQNVHHQRNALLIITCNTMAHFSQCCWLNNNRGNCNFVPQVMRCSCFSVAQSDL